MAERESKHNEVTDWRQWLQRMWELERQRRELLHPRNAVLTDITAGGVSPARDPDQGPRPSSTGRECL